MEINPEAFAIGACFVLCFVIMIAQLHTILAYEAEMVELQKEIKRSQAMARAFIVRMNAINHN